MYMRAVRPIALAAYLLFHSAPLLAGPPHFAGDRPLDMRHIKLDLKVDLEAKTVAGVATLDLTALRPVSTIALDAVDFAVKSVNVRLGDGPFRPCDYENDGEKLTLTLPEEIAAGTKVGVRIDYRLSDPSSGLSFFAPSEEEPDVPYLVWSQGQTTTNRHWVPGFDHPNEMQTTEILCTVAKPYIAISNGTRISEVDNGDGTRTFHWRQDQPHVMYLMTLVCGDFVSKTETWRGIPVTYYVRKKFEDMIDNSFSNTLPMLDFFSDKLGVPYAWPKYAQVCCYSFGGGMENTSSTTLGERTLHNDRAHLDTSSDGLVAHELAHQWFGDLLTCDEWAHTWLNEGFASYFEALWDEHHNGADEFAHNMYNKANRAISGGKDKPIVYRAYDNEGQQFDSRAYPKGAWVVHMIRRQLGDDLFWKCIKTYCTRFRHQTVETSDLRKTIEEVTGRSFERFFHDWTARPGHPVLMVRYKWLAEDGLASVDIEQTQKSEAFHFPLRLEFHGDGGKPVTLTKQIEKKNTSFLMPLEFRPTMFRVDPGNSVLKELTEDKPRDLWVAQLTRDEDVEARIRAVKHFAKTNTQQDRELLAGRLGSEPFWAVQAQIAGKLGEDDDDAGRDALLAAVSTKHPKARAAIVRALGGFDDAPAVEAALRKIIQDGDPSYRVEESAIRAFSKLDTDDAVDVLTPLLERDSHNEMIRSAALRGLGDQRDAEVIDLLIAWTSPGKPMSCRSSALSALSELLSKIDVEPDVLDAAVEAIADCLDSKSRRLPRSALSALGKLGTDAKAALPRVDEAAERGSRRMQSMAKRIAKQIRENAPKDEQLAELRDQMNELREENKRLVERLDKIEAKSGADSPAATGESVSRR